MRNPLLDPRPGDVVIYGPQWQRERAEVTAVRNNGDVEYRMGGQLFCIWRSKWWSMMAGAEVIRTAEEGK